MAHDAQTQRLRLFILTVMLARESHKTFGQTYEADAKRTLIDNRFDSVVRRKLFASVPQTRHQQWELLGKCRFLEIEPVIELAGCYIKHRVKFREKHGYTLLAVYNVHALYRKADNIDGSETQIATADGCLFTKAVFKHTCATSHSSHLPAITLRIISTPVFMLVICSIKVDEIWEKTPGCNLACKLVQVIIRVFRQIADTAFLFPYLYREYSCCTVANSAISRVKYLADDSTTFGRCVSTIV